MIKRIIKSKETLIFLAFILSLSLCIKQIELGYNNLHRQHPNDFFRAFFDIPITLEYIGLNAIYLIWMARYWRRIKYFVFTDILKAASFFLFIAFLGYPTTSDIYLYLQYGLMDLNGINPFVNAASTFTSNISPLLYWKQTSTYGPVSQLFFMVAASSLSISLVLGVYIFKALCLLVHGANTYFIWKQLRFSPYQSQIALAYLINPEILFECVTNAHVDALISMTLIALNGCLKRNYYLAGAVIIWAGFLAKTVPIIWLPLILAILLRKQRWKSFLGAILISLTIVAVLRWSILPTVEAWVSLLNPGVAGRTAGSLHNMFAALLDTFQFLSSHLKHILLSVFSLITYTGFAFYYIWTLLKTYFKRPYSKADSILNIGWITMALFLFATPWLQPWYTSILLAITALNINSRRFVLTSLTFCLTSNCSYYALGYDRTNLSGVIGSLLAVGPAILVLLFVKERNWKRF